MPNAWIMMLKKGRIFLIKPYTYIVFSARSKKRSLALQNSSDLAWGKILKYMYLIFFLISRTTQATTLSWIFFFSQYNQRCFRVEVHANQFPTMSYEYRSFALEQILQLVVKPETRHQWIFGHIFRYWRWCYLKT